MLSLNGISRIADLFWRNKCLYSGFLVLGLTFFRPRRWAMGEVMETVSYSLQRLLSADFLHLSPHYRRYRIVLFSYELQFWGDFGNKWV